MYCENCGKEIKDNTNFCKYCGMKVSENLVKALDAEKNLIVMLSFVQTVEMK